MEGLGCPDRVALPQRGGRPSGVPVDGYAACAPDTKLVWLQRPVMEEALYETTILRQFTGLSLDRISDETTILNFRRLLEV